VRPAQNASSAASPEERIERAKAASAVEFDDACPTIEPPRRKPPGCIAAKASAFALD
jgi:hypothetical protein